MAVQYNHDHENDILYFASTNFRRGRVKFGIKTDDRRRHMYILGKTGMGKTTLLENLVIQDIHLGHGVAYIDPHGDTAEKIIDHVPPHRINDVVYINPADLEFPVGFNVLESVDSDKNHLLVAGLMSVFKKIWPDVWSPRMEYILQNCIWALTEVPNSTLLGISRLLADRAYREDLVAQLKDPVIKGFWEDEFANYSEKFATEAIAPVQNKVGQFLSASIIRNIVAQVKSTFDLKEIMDQGKILIVNLSKGRIGEDNSHLLGGLLITKIQLAVMERIDSTEEERPDFYLYVDEFQNFATESFANILSEARKFHLNLVITHQYIAQLEHEGNTVLRDAVFGNVGTLVVMRVGANDAEFLEKEFEPYFTMNDLVNLPKHDVYLRLMIDGAASQPFSATTLPPIADSMGSAQKVIKVSRERYTVARAVIEDKIIRWSQALHESAASTAKKASEAREKKKRPLIEAYCDDCGKLFNPPFRPLGDKPVFCQECYTKRKEGAVTGPPRLPRAPRIPETRYKSGGVHEVPVVRVSPSTPSIRLVDALKHSPPPQRRRIPPDHNKQ